MYTNCVRRWGLLIAVCGAFSLAAFPAHAGNDSELPEGLERLVAEAQSPEPATKTAAIDELRKHEERLIQYLVFKRSDTALQALRCIEGPQTATSDRAAKLNAPEKVKELIVNLGSSYPVVRLWAASDLGELAAEAVPAIPLLLDALEDDEYEADQPDDMVQQVCEGAQYALGKLGEPAVDALIKRLESRKARARERTAELLGKLGVQRAVPSLLAVLRRDDVHEAWGTAQALERLNAKEAVEPLIGLLTRDDYKTRSRAASALVKFGDLRANETLKKLAVRDEPFCVIAIGSLCRINPAGTDLVIDLLQHESPRVRRLAATDLSRDEIAKAIDPLLDAWHDKAVQAGVGPWLDWIVEQRGVEAAVRAFTLEDAADEFRRFALVEIVRHEHPRAVEFLLEMLPNPEFKMRRTTIAAAKRLRLKEAVEPLIEIVTSAECNLDQGEAAEALAEIGDPKAFDVLVTALSGSDPLVVSYAARGLAKLGDPRTVSPLLTLMKKDNYHTRTSAMWALGEFDDPRVATAMIKAADHPDEYVRQLAFRVLGKVDGPGVVDMLVKALDDESVRSWALSSLARHTEAQIPDLIRERFDPEFAARAIGTIQQIRHNIRQNKLREKQRSGT